MPVPAARLLPLVLLAAVAAGAGEARRKRVPLPGVLGDHGFGSPCAPLRVEFVSRIGEPATWPTDAATGEPWPVGTTWVFTDPNPVWKALKEAATRRFSPGMFPAAIARLTIREIDDAEVEGGATGKGRRIHLHYREGWATLQSPDGPGGDWSFAPEADRALVRLLSTVAPAEVGVPAVWLRSARHVGDPHAEGLRVTVARDAEGDARIQARFRARYGEDREVGLPERDPGAPHLVVAAWLPPRDRKDDLDGGGAVRVGDTLRWDLRLDPRAGEPAEGWAPAELGAFRVPAGVTRLVVTLDGEPAAELALR